MLRGQRGYRVRVVQRSVSISGQRDSRVREAQGSERFRVRVVQGQSRSASEKLRGQSGSGVREGSGVRDTLGSERLRSQIS